MLSGYRWTNDLPVNGMVTENQTTGDVQGTVIVSGVSSGTLTVEWNTLRPLANALISGRLDGKRVYAAIPAP
jgi:hypothetical protein